MTMASHPNELAENIRRSKDRYVKSNNRRPRQKNPMHALTSGCDGARAPINTDTFMEELFEKDSRAGLSISTSTLGNEGNATSTTSNAPVVSSTSTGSSNALVVSSTSTSNDALVDLEATLKQQYESKLAAAKTEYESKLAAVKTEYESKIKSKLGELHASHRENNELIRSLATSNSSKERLERNLEDVNHNHVKTMDRVDREYKQTKAKMQEEISLLKSANSTLERDREEMIDRLRDTVSEIYR